MQPLRLESSKNYKKTCDTKSLDWSHRVDVVDVVDVVVVGVWSVAWQRLETNFPYIVVDSRHSLYFQLTTRRLRAFV